MTRKPTAIEVTAPENPIMEIDSRLGAGNTHRAANPDGFVPNLVRRRPNKSNMREEGKDLLSQAQISVIKMQPDLSLIHSTHLLPFNRSPERGKDKI